MLSKLSYLNSNIALTLGYLNPALNNSAQMFGSPDLPLYNKANDPLFNSLRKSDVEAQVKFTSKAMERARVNSLAIHLRDKDWNTKGPGSTLGCDRISF